MNKTTVYIKIILSILLLISLLKMPYGYYQLERFIALIGFALLAYRAHEHNDNNEAIIYGGLALLFQPFIKIALGRQIWNVVDVIVAIGLVITILWQRKHV
jgi:hypothetical protein